MLLVQSIREFLQLYGGSRLPAVLGETTCAEAVQETVKPLLSDLRRNLLDVDGLDAQRRG